MKKIIPEIAVDNCFEVLQFYHRVFGGEMKNVQKADGNEMFKGHEGKIMHAELHINGECVLYMNDNFNGRAGSSVTLLLELDSGEELDGIFAALAEKGQAVFPPQKTFWGAYHAVVTDYTGLTWGLNYTPGK